jgi:23S rRNA (uridine2552-2'-O)-methyltransferase
VVDLGCWPGGWLQVASELAAIEPPLRLTNVIAIQADLADPGVAARILEALRGGPADVLLCDAAPKLTGVRATDRAREEALLESVASLVPQLLRADGAMIVKLLEGPEAQAVERRLRGRFAWATATRPAASRKGTSERYLLAWEYRGPEPAAG